ncbi:hypothetical protein PAHAL_9G304600 [Panicum hallii]|uniref:Peptidase A2 domain-containing protein n=1 Tax=Panicum hallii TaxID=206008 RepID=A0A2T8I312_9POAL|nr:hypothetical protein PAHAL_9G304600 [Panicum hallii]
MKVDIQPFPGVNMVEGYDRSPRRQLDFTLGINMAGLASRRQTKNKEADPSDRPQKEEKGYVTEEQKYEYQYQQRLWRESEEEEYERRTGKRLKKHEDVRVHWHCSFFRYCWDSGMIRLPTTRDCPECGPVKIDAKGVSVFRRLGPVPTQQEQFRSPQRRVDLDEGEDKYHQAQIQRLRSLEEAEARYLKSLRKARPDLAEQVHHVQKRESRPPKEWRPNSTRADVRTSAVTHMKPHAKNYKHLKAFYLKGYINGQPVNKMLEDTGAAVNIMPYSVLRRLGWSTGDLIETNVTLSDFNGQTSEAQGVLSMDLTIGNKTVLTSFFIVNSKSTYNVLLGRDWIHTNCCIPSTMHQCLIQWDGDEVEVVHADDSIEISHAAMSIWDTEDQELISGMSLEGCDRIEATKNGVRLVLSTGLTE